MSAFRPFDGCAEGGFLATEVAVFVGPVADPSFFELSCDDIATREVANVRGEGLETRGRRVRGSEENVRVVARWWESLAERNAVRARMVDGRSLAGGADDGRWDDRVTMMDAGERARLYKVSNSKVELNDKNKGPCLGPAYDRDMLGLCPTFLRCYSASPVSINPKPKLEPGSCPSMWKPLQVTLQSAGCFSPTQACLREASVSSIERLADRPDTSPDPFHRTVRVCFPRRLVGNFR